jgi:tetratricopeptide (TPR) repeat protein
MCDGGAAWGGCDTVGRSPAVGVDAVSLNAVRVVAGAFVLSLLIGGPAVGGAAPVAPPGDVLRLPAAAHFDGYASARPVDPQAVTAAGGPFAYAAQRIGLDPELELPGGLDGGYRFTARFPLIDHVANRPLYLKRWADQLRGMGGADAGAIDATDPTQLLGHTLGKAADTSEVESEVARLRDETRARWSQLERFGPELQAALIDLIAEFRWAQAEVSGVRGAISADAQAVFAETGYLAGPDGRMASLTGDTTMQRRFLEAAREVDYARLQATFVRFSTAVDRFADRIATWSAQNEPAGDPTLATEPIRLRLFGHDDIVIGGFGDDTYGDETARVPLLIDLGGNDRYTGPVATTTGRNGVGVLIDCGGHDRYGPSDPSPTDGRTQAYAYQGIAILYDHAGNDQYSAWHYAQSCAVMGFALLTDRRGDDRYTAQTAVQGAGMFGFAMLRDLDGEDIYRCANFGQGAGTTLGVGALVDVAEANPTASADRYELGIRHDRDTMGQVGFGQGGAMGFRHIPWRDVPVAYGGVGILLDRAGNDRYRAAGWTTTGGSYLMSLGALIDDGGNDHYTCGTGLGSGIHLTNAIFIDTQGDDTYDAGFRCGGSAGDRSVAMFFDEAGDDLYRGRTSNWGTACKPYAYSLFVDAAGDDVYDAQRPDGEIRFNLWHSFGGNWPESEPWNWGWGVALDLGGADRYGPGTGIADAWEQPRGGFERHSFGHGLALDIEWPAGVTGLLPDVGDPPAEQRDLHVPPRPDGTRDGVAHDDRTAAMTAIKRLAGHESALARFATIGEVTAIPGPIAPVLRDALLHATSPGLQRDLLDIIFARRDRPEIATALREIAVRSPAPEVRATAINDLAWIGDDTDESIDALRRAATDDSPMVRRYALRALTAAVADRPADDDRLIQARAIGAAALTRDPDADVRRTAAAMLPALVPDTAGELLLAALQAEPSPVVRTAVLQALAPLATPAAAEAFRARWKSDDVYIRRAAAVGSALLGEVDAIGVLIESLAFPSINAFDNYDRNIPNTLSALTAVDFPDPQRYDRAVWREWFTANRESIDIAANLAAYRAFRAYQSRARGLSVDEQIAALDAILAAHAGYRPAADRLARLLNSVAWGAVTGDKRFADVSPDRAVEMAQRAVELRPGDWNIVDTLAEALLAAGDLDAAAAWCDKALAAPGVPGNLQRLFRERQDRIAAARADAGPNR